MCIFSVALRTCVGYNVCMGSIIDEFELNKENFEQAIGAGATKKQVEIIFRTNTKGLDAWCGKEYGVASFPTVYEFIRNIAVNKYLDVMKSWAVRGHSSAMGIMTEFLLDSKKKDNTVKIVFGNDLKEENEEDKEDE